MENEVVTKVTKVTLTKAQADAMDAIKREIETGCTTPFYSKATVVAFKLKGLPFHDDRRAANEIDDDTFIQALYNGYKIELTTEDKVREYYVSLKTGNTPMDPDVAREKRLTLITTVNKLGLKIEGVNA